MQQIETKKSPIFGCLIGGLIILAGAALFNYTSKLEAKADESLSWPTATGKVLRSSLKRDQRTEGIGRKKMKSGPETFGANILYEYQVEGSSYKSNQISLFRTESSDRSEAEALLRKYPKGAEVTVSYNPQDHSEAILQPGSTDRATLLYMAALLVGGFGVIACVYSVT